MKAGMLPSESTLPIFVFMYEIDRPSRVHFQTHPSVRACRTAHPVEDNLVFWETKRGQTSQGSTHWRHDGAHGSPGNHGKQRRAMRGPQICWTLTQPVTVQHEHSGVPRMGSVRASYVGQAVLFKVQYRYSYLKGVDNGDQGAARGAGARSSR